MKNIQIILIVFSVLVYIPVVFATCDSSCQAGRNFGDSLVHKRFVVPGIIAGTCLGPVAMVGLPPIAYNWKRPLHADSLKRDSCFYRGMIRRSRFNDMNSAFFGSSMGTVILFSIVIVLSSLSNP
jgi:hypothetical protein